MVEIVGDPGRPLLIRTDSSIPVVVVDTEGSRTPTARPDPHTLRSFVSLKSATLIPALGNRPCICSFVRGRVMSRIASWTPTARPDAECPPLHVVVIRAKEKTKKKEKSPGCPLLFRTKIS